MADKKVEKTADKKPNGFVRAMSGIARYFRECKGEVKKVVWPTPKSTFKNTGIVILAIALVGLFIFGLDRGLYALLGIIMNVSG